MPAGIALHNAPSCFADKCNDLIAFIQLLLAVIQRLDARSRVTGGGDANAPKITTWKEVDALGNRAAKGDKEAIAQLTRLTPEMKAKLK